MNAVKDFHGMTTHELRGELDDLYADYIGCLDDRDLDKWPEFFTEKCVYKIIPRENHRRGLPLATWLSESKGMLMDRVVAIRQTSMYAPRYLRHLVSGIRIKGWEADTLSAQANYLVLETLIDDVTRIFNAGAYLDRLVVESGRLKFKEKLCVFDSIVVPNSLIYPI
jgi:3-phenylpropionate/cinnamic acid dioxygenase small subunit